MSARPDQFDEWMSKAELSELVARLSRAMDRADKRGIEECYTENSYDDHGEFKGSGAQFADYLCSGPPIDTHHQLGQSIFEIDGDEAWGETYFVMFGLGARPLYGRYIDYCLRRDRVWALKYRRVVPELTVAGDDINTYWRSSRSRHDPAYDRLRAPSTEFAPCQPEAGEAL